MNNKQAKRLRKEAYDMTVGDNWKDYRKKTVPTTKPGAVTGQTSLMIGLRPTSGRAIYQSLKRDSKR